MARIAFDERELTAITRALVSFAPPGVPRPAMFPVVAIDPGKRSMGWAVIDVDRKLHSGEGVPSDVVRDLDALLSLTGPPLVFTSEAPYSVSAAQILKAQHRSGGVGAVYALGRATGYVEGGIRRHTLRAARWEPKPSTWRAVLGLNRRGDGDMTSRDATAEAVVLWARATTRMALRRNNGEPCVDEAMAIAMAYATLSVLQSLMLQMRAPPKQAVPAASPSPTRARKRKATALSLPLDGDGHGAES